MGSSTGISPPGKCRFSWEKLSLSQSFLDYLVILTGRALLAMGGRVNILFVREWFCNIRSGKGWRRSSDSYLMYYNVGHGGRG